MKYKELLLPYNTWWNDPRGSFPDLPSYQRPIFDSIFQSIKTVPQIISITGPRRVGKSVIVKQLIKRLIGEGTDPQQLCYFSMDDPALLRAEIDHDDFFDSLMKHSLQSGKGREMYYFLDEIQRFDRWELFLKKYHDLRYPVRFVVSGFASSPIFKRSRERLLGRIKDFHLFPFSFREFMMCQFHDDPLAGRLREIHAAGNKLVGSFTRHPEGAKTDPVNIPGVPPELRGVIENQMNRYFLEGGFPEVWKMPSWETKLAYLYDNQVSKVISEDLAIAFELRKPEGLKRFYISLLENPGMEINFQKLAQKLGLPRPTIEKYFPMLEMTDLVTHIGKFSRGVARIRRGNIKCYLVDLALRNAILRVNEELLRDETALGYYAENCVFNALRRMAGIIAISYYRKKESEVDFIVHLAAGKYLPVEVKYRKTINDGNFRVLKNFQAHLKSSLGIVVTRKWDDFGLRGRLLYLPLPQFLLLFD